MNAPDPPHWTLNSCFCVFRTIWMYLELFGCLQNWVQNGPKWCKSSCHEVVSNFLQRMHPIHPIGPYLMFQCVSYYLGAFGTVWFPYETRCKMGRTSAKVRATKPRRNFSQRTHSIHPIGPKLTFWCVSFYLGAFGTV